MRPTLNLPLDDPEWIELLKAELAKGRSVVALARECGIARSSLSMLLSGSYPAQSLDLVTRKHAARIIRQYRDQVNGGTLSFGQGLKVGMTIVLLPALLFGVFDVLYTKLFNPGFWDEYGAAELAKMKASLPQTLRARASDRNR